jgi:hypothetical protein
MKFKSIVHRIETQASERPGAVATAATGGHITALGNIIPRRQTSALE